MTSIPDYDELPELGGLGVRHAWDVLPHEEGTLAFACPDAAAAAAHEVGSGETVPLNLPLDAFDPPLFGRAQVRHSIVETGRNEVEDVIGEFNPQASSQLDGLAHVRAREHGFFGGSTTIDDARERVGMHHWARRGIAARGVLLDVEAARRRAGRPADPFLGEAFDPGELLEVADAQGVALRPGDALLVRTGWAAARMAAGDAPSGSWNGLAAGEDMARMLWNRRVCLVGSDNPAVENAPGDRAVGSLHRRLLPALGMPLMELLDLERLARRCADNGRWDFLFVSVPLAVRGGVSSPANAMAVL
ncbi:cyclase family protein [Amycolatopsis thermoflava]|uniref:cyclase family protein n=1 Tax=Amycolatopsis thermoflava TaxID=84480 RepID=UPI00382E318A